jgi:serine/threonine protein kinase
MTSDHTQHQSDDARNKARSLSMAPTRPPAEIAGYALEKFLGQGAYGEVWSATDQKTGKSVAVKFYTQQTSDDVQMLAQEVEKLLALSTDRYVVQLLDVGWDSTPPYYVMDYLEHGSLEDRLRQDLRLAPDDAVEMFEELAQGLMHLHGKGILHCDLKPANVLLDQDSKPRVADFGQSRLSTEDTGALGTLYYMAPEQADLDAVPDARWDVYGLGAMLYCMLTGSPPFRSSKLTEKIESSERIGQRLAAYRRALASAPTPTNHRGLPGVDRALADIIDRCIAVDPEKRFHSIQSVIQALNARRSQREKRPLILLGILGPLLLLGGMSLFGGWAFQQATSDTTEAVKEKADESNLFKARLAARSAADRIQDYFNAVEQLSHDDRFRAAFITFINDESLREARQQISDPMTNTVTVGGKRVESDPVVAGARERLMQAKLRLAIEPFLRKRLDNVDQEFPVASSWFVCDRWGNQIASVFAETNRTQLNNYSYRTYFTGKDFDLKDEKGRYLVSETIAQRTIAQLPHLSAIFLSQANNKWKVAFSAPIIVDGQVLGVVAMTEVLGDFVDFDFGDGSSQYVMMFDGRTGSFTGTILEHPLLARLEAETGVIPKALTQKQISFDDDRQAATGFEFADPMGEEPEGKDYNRRSIAAAAEVILKRKPVTTQESNQLQTIDEEAGTFEIATGLKVLAVEDYASVIDPVNTLSQRLMNLLVIALLSLLALTVAMWWLVTRTLGRGSANANRISGTVGRNTWSPDNKTISYDENN